jgi:hypothetical protein
MPRGVYARAGSFADKAALKLGQEGNHLPHGSACRSVGVDVLRERAEFNPSSFEVVEHGYQVAQAAAQSVEFPQ